MVTFNTINMEDKSLMRELLEKQNSKMEVIVTFLIVLEMMKIGKITIEQEDLFGEIQIIVKEESVIS